MERISEIDWREHVSNIVAGLFGGGLDIAGVRIGSYDTVRLVFESCD